MSNWQPFEHHTGKHNIGASVWYGGWSELARAQIRSTSFYPSFNPATRPTREDGTALDLLGGRRDSFCDIMCDGVNGFGWTGVNGGKEQFEFWKENTLPDDPHKYIPMEAFKVHVFARLNLC